MDKINRNQLHPSNRNQRPELKEGLRTFLSEMAPHILVVAGSLSQDGQHHYFLLLYLLFQGVVKVIEAIQTACKDKKTNSM